MTSYVNQYGTEFAVQKHDGAPALMCRQRDSSQWTLSGSLANLVGDAKTAKDLQAILDRAAKEKGWEPVRGFPDWELPMVKEILTWPWMPKTAEEFTSSFFKSCDAVRARAGGSCAAGLYDTGPQGIKFSKFYQDGRLYAEHTWPDFVRRCIAQGIAPVPNADPTSAGPESNAAESGAESEGLPAAESAVLPAGQKNADEECPHLEPLENSKKYTCKCSICGDKFPNREICNKSFKSCGWYLDRQDKEAQTEDDEEEASTADVCQCRTCGRKSCFAHGCAKECPANAEESCLTVICPEYIERTDTTCNCQTTAAPTGDAAATTVERAVKEQPRGVEISTTSESGADAVTSTRRLSGSIGPSTSPAPASRADAGAATQSLSAAGPASLAAEAAELPVFDYSGLDDNTAERLKGLAERANMLRSNFVTDMALIVSSAHWYLCGVVAPCDNSKHGNRGDKSFRAWCASIGIGKDTAYRLLNVQTLIDGSTDEELRTLEKAPAKLLYAAAKPSAPAELVQAVKDGDITSHKQYQDLLKKYQKGQAELEQMEKRMEDNSHAANAACNMLADEQKRRKAAEDECAAAKKNLDEACKERDGARDALRAAKMRADKWQAEVEAIKAKPIEAQVVDEAEVNRRAQELADKQTAELRQQLADLQAEPSDAEQTSRDAYDAVVLSCRTIENTWKTIQPMMSKMDDGARRLAINQISGLLEKIENEVKTCL